MGKELELWNKFNQPPKEALKPILAGRLKGKTDINPQWRFKALTEVFGPCGTGWKYEIKRVWNEPGSDDQVFAFAEVELFYVTESGLWSTPIPGIGGSMLIEKESKGMHSSDEGYKMAVTDAISVACKPLGVAADIYMGQWDGDKYTSPAQKISEDQAANLVALAQEVKADHKKFCDYFGVKDINELTTDRYDEAIALMEKKRAA